MDDKTIARIPVYNRPVVGTNDSQPNGGFGFFLPSIICIVIIGNPRNFFRFAKRVGRQIKTQLLNDETRKKLGSGVTSKPFLIPFAFGGTEGLISSFRGVDDDLNVLTAGTLTGLLYNASTGNILRCGSGGLTGLLLSSLYCLLKPRNVVEMIEEKQDYGNSKYDNSCDDYWKPT